MTCISSQNWFAVTKQMLEPVQLKTWWCNLAVSIGEGKDLQLLSELALLRRAVGLRWKAGKTNGVAFREGQHCVM